MVNKCEDCGKEMTHIAMKCDNCLDNCLSDKETYPDFTAKRKIFVRNYSKKYGLKQKRYKMNIFQKIKARIKD